MTNYIIGGGLSGLIAAYYNPDYEVLTPETSGFVESKVGRAFVVIHEDEHALGLFQDLEVPSFVKDIRLGYYYPATGVTRDPPDGFTRQYLDRKLPSDMQPPADAELGQSPGSQFRALFVDENLISALANEVSVRYGFVKSIGPSTIEFDSSTGQEVLGWDSVISTVPAPICRNIVEAEVSWDLNCHPMTYGEIEHVPGRYTTIPWDYLYVVDNVPYHRVISHVVSDHYFVECFGERNLHAELDVQVHDEYHHETGVIEKEAIDPPYEGMQFLGRWAEWNPDRLINEVIAEAKS